MSAQPSQLNSVTVSQVGSTNPSTIAKAAHTPLRVALVNIGPVTVLLAHDDGTLINTPVFANSYQLAPGREVVIVLIPKQGLYAAGAGVGGQISVAISEAIPTKWMEA